MPGPRADSQLNCRRWRCLVCAAGLDVAEGDCDGETAGRGEFYPGGQSEDDVHASDAVRVARRRRLHDPHPHWFTRRRQNRVRNSSYNVATNGHRVVE